jgi:hypothetical protein
LFNEELMSSSTELSSLEDLPELEAADWDCWPGWVWAETLGASWEDAGAEEADPASAEQANNKAASTATANSTINFFIVQPPCYVVIIWFWVDAKQESKCGKIAASVFICRKIYYNIEKDVKI